MKTHLCCYCQRRAGFTMTDGASFIVSLFLISIRTKKQKNRIPADKKDRSSAVDLVGLSTRCPGSDRLLITAADSVIR